MRKEPSGVNLADYRRIIVCGPTGSGKSTLAREIAKRLNLTYIEMDALFWEPGWKGASDEVFFERISRAIECDGWVLDGNYTRTRHLTLPRVELVIWLHFPLVWTFCRLLSRTVRRCRVREELWPGCREAWRSSLFSRDGILIWLLRSHRRIGRQLRECASDPAWAAVSLIAFRRPADLERWRRAEGLG